MTIWMAYFLAALAASGVFVAAGRRSRRVLGSASLNGRYELPIDPLWGGAEEDVSTNQHQADAEAAIRLALKRLTPLLRGQSIQADVAVSPGLLVRMRVAALADLVEELLVVAIHAAPASRLLLTASARGDQVEISTTDDLPGADPGLRAASVRGLMQRASSDGGSLHIDVRADEGTTMTLRLAAGTERRSVARTSEAAEGPNAPWSNVPRPWGPM